MIKISLQNPYNMIKACRLWIGHYQGEIGSALMEANHRGLENRNFISCY
jgi:hypothetical protein